MIHTDHVPVMTQTVIDLFSQTPKPQTFLDMTFGRGGHAKALLQHFPESTIVALDRDPQAIAFAKQDFCPPYAERFSCIEGRFSQLDTLFPQHPSFSGILCDLGVSSPQLDQADRGFSFLKEGPLDMRMTPSEKKTAAHIVNHTTERELADLFFHLGQEKFSRKIAKAIVKRRAHVPFRTTTDLSQHIQALLPSGRIHPATRIFQALRMSVNQELEELTKALPKTIPLLKPNGCLVVISFHSLEDRCVKHFFQSYGRRSKNGPLPAFSRISLKPMGPSEQEVHQNSRARSAKLRWGMLITQGVLS